MWLRPGVSLRRAVGLVCGFGISGALLAQTPTAPAPGLTLGEAITRALAANPTIAAARLQRPIDVAGVAVARERLNPEVQYETSRSAARCRRTSI